MSCNQFQSQTPACKTFTFIEPDDTLLSVTSSGVKDQSLDEAGDTVIPSGVPRMRIDFVTPKASFNYKFEYLYIDALGISNPGDVRIVVVDQNQFGFTVDFAGTTLSDGYILRWRVVVLNLQGGLAIDAPENLRLQLPQARVYTATFVNPRSNTTYGFSELRVENLVDEISSQRVVSIQVAAKTQANFVIGINPPPDTGNYFLVARTP